MKSIAYALAVLALAATVKPVHASGPVAVYALIDKVTMEPNANNPERIRIYGVFSVAQGQASSYTAPSRGFLYFSLSHSDPAQTKKEWADLQSVAGTRQVVGFGAGWFQIVHVYEVHIVEPPVAPSPDEYALNAGVVKVNPDQAHARTLLEFKYR
jgi:tRNA U38,U39,U40 pseudouridine synthase TruA